MKKGIHPKIYRQAKVTDLSNGEVFYLASTRNDLKVEVTNLSHPFYTGKRKIVDTENLVKKFSEKMGKADKTKVLKKREKNLKRSAKVTSIKPSDTISLRDMLKNVS